MRYIRVKWIHNSAEDPIELWSELNDARWETRKVDVFRNDVLGYADAESSVGSTQLSIEPLPEIDEINEDSQFQAACTTRDEFERIWRAAIQGSSSSFR
ncbi:DUF6881 domain-containing protein [Hyphomicrobium sp.]|uniref:DUF6881 domain-containing protein n=1 Tax=Hyphomicrobium sp. TaxID=82 RepID=UPI003F6F62BE